MSTGRPSVSAQWRDVYQALDHAEQWYARWEKQGEIASNDYLVIVRQCSTQRQQWQRNEANNQLPAKEIGLPMAVEGESAAARSLRHWIFLEREIRRLGNNRMLRLAVMHALLAEARERKIAVASQLGPQDILEVQPVTDVETTSLEEPSDDLTVFPVDGRKRRLPNQGLDSSASPRRRESSDRPRPPALPRRSMAEIVLDPRNAQWLLAFGGALMVVGLVILLYVNEYFTPATLALGVGLTNGALLLLGWYVLRSTKFEIVGQGLTLLACVVMPLNLWYYHANDLVTVDGHLWIAAVIITALYAASAWVLRSELFVFIFVGGLTLTGMLFLADLPPSPERFWEIASPATLLVVLGLVCIHAERAFPNQPGPFSRKRFGLAFFFSGQALLAAGLLLVMGAQFLGDWLYEPLFKATYTQLGKQPSPIVSDLRWLALLLVATGTYGYVYSDLVVRRLGLYVYIAAFTLCWLLVLCLQFFHIALGIEAAIFVLSLAGLAINLLQATVLKGNPVTRSLPYLGVMLPLVAVLLAVVVYLNAISPDLRSVWMQGQPNWTYVAAMLVTAVSCRVGAHLYRHSHEALAAVYYFATAGATMMGATALLAALGLEEWSQHAPVLMLLPSAYLVAARLYVDRTAARPMLWVANVTLAVLLFSSIVSAFDGFTHFVQQQPLNLILALFFAEAALFYGLAAALVRQPAAVHCCTAMVSAAVWQMLTYLGVNPEYYALAFAMVGVLLLISYRFAVLEGITNGRFADEAFQSGNTLLVISFAVTFIIGLGRLALQLQDWPFVFLCGGMTLVGIAALVLVRQVGWRRAYVVLTVAQTAMTFLALTMLSELSTAQKIEIVSVAMGIVLLVLSHIGWYREQARQNDLVTLGLLLGSLLVGLPLAWATMVDRMHDQFLVLNELGFLAAGVLLLISGILCRLKATTITGATLTGLYFATLLIFVQWSRLNTLAWFILVAGGLVFSAGLALSVFRERLLTLPARIRRGEGVWLVLKWR